MSAATFAQIEAVGRKYDEYSNAAGYAVAGVDGAVAERADTPLEQGQEENVAKNTTVAQEQEAQKGEGEERLLEIENAELTEKTTSVRNVTLLPEMQGLRIPLQALKSSSPITNLSVAHLGKLANNMVMLAEAIHSQTGEGRKPRGGPADGLQRTLSGEEAATSVQEEGTQKKPTLSKGLIASTMAFSELLRALNENDDIKPKEAEEKEKLKEEMLALLESRGLLEGLLEKNGSTRWQDWSLVLHGEVPSTLVITQAEVEALATDPVRALVEYDPYFMAQAQAKEQAETFLETFAVEALLSTQPEPGLYVMTQGTSDVVGVWVEVRENEPFTLLFGDGALVDFPEGALQLEKAEPEQKVALLEAEETVFAYSDGRVRERRLEEEPLITPPLVESPLQEKDLNMIEPSVLAQEAATPEALQAVNALLAQEGLEIEREVTEEVQEASSVVETEDLPAPTRKAKPTYRMKEADTDHRMGRVVEGLAIAKEIGGLASALGEGDVGGIVAGIASLFEHAKHFEKHGKALEKAAEEKHTKAQAKDTKAPENITGDVPDAPAVQENEPVATAVVSEEVPVPAVVPEEVVPETEPTLKTKEKEPLHAGKISAHAYFETFDKNEALDATKLGIDPDILVGSETRSSRLFTVMAKNKEGVWQEQDGIYVEVLNQVDAHQGDKAVEGKREGTLNVLVPIRETIKMDDPGKEGIRLGREIEQDDPEWKKVRDTRHTKFSQKELGKIEFSEDEAGKADAPEKDAPLKRTKPERQGIWKILQKFGCDEQDMDTLNGLLKAAAQLKQGGVLGWAMAIDTLGKTLGDRQKASQIIEEGNEASGHGAANATAKKIAGNSDAGGDEGRKKTNVPVSGKPLTPPVVEAAAPTKTSSIEKGGKGIGGNQTGGAQPAGDTKSEAKPKSRFFNRVAAGAKKPFGFIGSVKSSLGRRPKPDDHEDKNAEHEVAEASPPPNTKTAPPSSRKTSGIKKEEKKKKKKKISERMDDELPAPSLKGQDDPAHKKDEPGASEDKDKPVTDMREDRLKEALGAGNTIKGAGKSTAGQTQEEAKKTAVVKKTQAHQNTVG